MNARRSLNTFSLFFVLALLMVACSDDESEKPEQQAVQNAPVLEETSTGDTQEAEKNEFTLQAESPLSKDLADAYHETCIDKDRDDLECEVFHSLVIVELNMALKDIERSRDQRGAEVALEALDLLGEPGILIAAMRVLGQFPDTPGIAEKTLPLLLESPWLEVQRTAANLLGRNPDNNLAMLGGYWSANHSNLNAENEYHEYPGFAAHYDAMDFPQYPGAEWFSPADSDRSVGWWTTDELTKVSAWFSAETGDEPLNVQQWAERMQAQFTASFQLDQSKLARVQELTEEYLKSQNPALIEQLQKLQEELYAPIQAAGEMSELGTEQITLPSTSEATEQTRFFIAEEKAGHVARLIIVYPLTSLGHTVIQEAWNLGDYPSAWPEVQRNDE